MTDGHHNKVAVGAAADHVAVTDSTHNFNNTSSFRKRRPPGRRF